MAKKEEKTKTSNAKKPEPRKAKDGEKKIDSKQVMQIAVPFAIVAIIAVVLYFVYANYLNTPFSTFQRNYDSASRVALAVTYGNVTQYSAEAGCSQYLIQTIAGTRNASTIDFFILNRTMCYYSPTGLGHAINISTVPASQCLGYARSEPSIFLNYSNNNSTVITPYHLYASGNAAYMAKCGIAVEIG